MPKAKCQAVLDRLPELATLLSQDMARTMDRDHREPACPLFAGPPAVRRPARCSPARPLFVGMPAKQLEGFADGLDDVLSHCERRSNMLLKALRWEFNLWRGMYLWARKRVRGLAPGDEPIGYAAATAPIMWALIILNVIEIVVFHFWIPWETVRVIVDILGVYSLIWMVGLLAVMKVHPHLATSAGLRIRYSATVDFTVPWAAIASVSPRIRTHHGIRTVRCEDATVAVGVSNQTNVDIVLRAPMVLPVPATGGEPVAEVRVYADDPAALIVSAERRRSTTGTSAPAEQPTP